MIRKILKSLTNEKELRFILKENLRINYSLQKIYLDTPKWSKDEYFCIDIILRKNQREQEFTLYRKIDRTIPNEISILRDLCTEWVGNLSDFLSENSLESTEENKSMFERKSEEFQKLNKLFTLEELNIINKIKKSYDF